jgi:hypothetical protein
LGGCKLIEILARSSIKVEKKERKQERDWKLRELERESV